jgi:hypothetical protein
MTGLPEQRPLNDHAFRLVVVLTKGFPDTPSKGLPEDGHEASEHSARPWIGCPEYYASAIVLT